MHDHNQNTIIGSEDEAPGVGRKGLSGQRGPSVAGIDRTTHIYA